MLTTIEYVQSNLQYVITRTIWINGDVIWPYWCPYNLYNDARWSVDHCLDSFMILHLRNIHVLPNMIIYIINQVFVVLHGDKLLININKCTFKQQEQIYLRLCQNQNGLSIKLRKILTIVDWIPLNNMESLVIFHENGE